MTPWGPGHGVMGGGNDVMMRAGYDVMMGGI